MSQVICFYHKGKPYDEFTNFARYPIRLDGKVWPTSEHYYQAQKHAGTPLEEQIRQGRGSDLPAFAARPGPRPLGGVGI